MKAFGLLVLVAMFILTVTAQAQDRQVLGYGSFFNNDLIGDGQDRWRTGSYTVSQLRGPAWDGALPERFGTLLEYRFRAEIIAPRDVANPQPGDRPYVGAVSAGLHSHWQRAQTEMALGLDVIVVGPQTGLDTLQDAFHDLFSAPRPRVDGVQVGNAIRPTVTFEAGRPYQGNLANWRPFVELQAGAETLMRVGGDISVGHDASGGVLLRDSATGHRYQGLAGGAAQGTSFFLGGDVAYVAESRYLDSQGVAPRASRSRLRAGVNVGVPGARVFYGITYLSEEFDNQEEGQILGSLDLRFRF
ncbi:MAG: lipid A-modifier LpxR family protein [Pseudomonadota bacterium]